MTYDGLDRLTAVTSPMWGSGMIPASYTYDALDNLVRVVVPPAGIYPGRDHHYCYDGTNRLTNVKTGGCNTGLTILGVGYDVQGNLDQWNGLDYVFDHGNRLRGVHDSTGAIETYRYDGLGRRVLAWSAAGLGNILSQYARDGRLVYQNDARTNEKVDYLYLGSRLVATRTRPISHAVYTTKYQHTDALGSPVAVTDANGVVQRRDDYEPFGKRINRANDNRPGFTGHVVDAATGLTYMQQRYYDPRVGRFWSVDPVAAHGSTGTNFNRYWYANNNPYKFTDPDGRRSICPGKNSCQIIQVASRGPVGSLEGSPRSGSGASADPANNQSKNTPSGQSVQSATASGQAVVDANGMIASTMQNHLAHSKMWRGENGKMYSNSWGGNQHTGARSQALGNANALKLAGTALFGISTAISIVDGIEAANNGDNFGAFQNGVDVGWGAAATYGGPAGLVGAASYTGTSFLVGTPVGRDYVVEPAANLLCSVSGNC